MKEIEMDESIKRIIVDCDGVIAGKSHGGDYSKSSPLEHGIKQVNKLYDMGYEVVLYTARYGDRENGNMHMQYEKGYREWTDWLDKHDVKYHHAFMGKPAGVLYIDDKAARVRGNDEEGWEEVWKEVEELKGKDKYGNHYTEEQRNYWDGFVG
jgi:capsule biosynthesis phosphatase